MNEPKLLKLADGSTIRFGNGRHPDEPIDLPCTPSEIFAEFGLTETDPGVKDVLDAFNKLLENRKNNEK